MVVVDDQRRVVGETLGFVDRFTPRGGGDARRGDLVVDAPADILLPRLAAVRPPGVLVGLVVQAAEYIDEAQLVEDLRQPGTLFGQETRILLVGAPVFQVDFAVRDVPVAAQDDLVTAILQFLQMNQKGLEEAKFGGLSMRPGRARRHVERDHPQLSEARLDIAALGVELPAPEAAADLVGRLAAVERDAAVALLFGEGMAGLVHLEAVELGVEVDLLALHFLQAHHVGALAGEPAEQPLARGGPYAVDVEGDYPQKLISTTRKSGDAAVRSGPLRRRVQKAFHFGDLLGTEIAAL